jgi:uncharacterized protein YdaU (DUF1376 family)
MSAPPFMQLYVADYLGDTRHLTTEQHGAYLLLLMTMWRVGGSLPNDAKTLARLAGCTQSRWSKIGAAVVAFFDNDGSNLVSRRLMLELEKAQEKSIKRAEAGTRGGVAKSLKNNAQPVAIATVLPEHSSEPELEPESKKETEATASAKTIEPKAKGSRLPDDWTPDPGGYAFATAQGMTDEEITLEADKFRDFWCAKPGAGGRKSDWPATWRNWCRNRRAGPRVAGGARPGGYGQGPSDFASIIAERRGRAGV